MVKKAFSLIEVIVALMIFSTASGSIMLFVSVNNSFMARHLKNQQKIELVRKYKVEYLIAGKLPFESENFQIEEDKVSEHIVIAGQEVTFESDKLKKITVKSGDEIILEEIVPNEK